MPTAKITCGVPRWCTPSGGRNRPIHAICAWAAASSNVSRWSRGHLQDDEIVACLCDFGMRDVRDLVRLLQGSLIVVLQRADGRAGGPLFQPGTASASTSALSSNSTASQPGALV